MNIITKSNYKHQCQPIAWLYMHPVTIIQQARPVTTENIRKPHTKAGPMHKTKYRQWPTSFPAQAE